MAHNKLRSIGIGSLVIAGLIVAAVSFRPNADESEQTERQTRARSVQSPTASAPGAIPASQIQSSSASSIPSQMKQDEDESSAPSFRTDDKGDLIVDELTKNTIEALIALNEPGKLNEAIETQTKNLPAAAQRKAQEMIDRFYHYQEAQLQAYPPGVAPPTEDDAIVQLDGLHALRQAHFGAEVADAFYAREEKLSRELIELMRLEKDQGLTMSEKADRAQAARDRLPTVAAIEKKNREPLPAQKDESKTVAAETADR